MAVSVSVAFLFSLVSSYTDSHFSAGTIPPIKSARGEGDDVKKLFSIGSPVILVTLGVALLFIIRKKRKEKRLKRLRGERRPPPSNSFKSFSPSKGNGRHI